MHGDAFLARRFEIHWYRITQRRPALFVAATNPVTIAQTTFSRPNKALVFSAILI
jgi:hypothetical protein